MKSLQQCNRGLGTWIVVKRASRMLIHRPLEWSTKLYIPVEGPAIAKTGGGEMAVSWQKLIVAWLPFKSKGESGCHNSFWLCKTFFDDLHFLLYSSE